MKKLLLLLMAVFTVFTVYSCRDEDQQGNEDKVNASFSFKVERDTDFIEKAVGETSDLKFNIKPNYKFDYTPMYIKYTGDKNGVLTMDSITLEQNKEYEVKNADNILKYVANEEGTHKLKITLVNGKKQSVTEEFELKYGVSEFDVKLEGGTGDFYQGQTISYIGKITPKNPADTKGYTIKFNTYEGTIKLSDLDIEMGKEYPITDISNFRIATISKKSGASKISYTIKNSTVSRDFEIQQEVKARTLTVNLFSVTPNSVTPTNNFTLKAIVQKNPVSDNKEIKIKTWISEADNGDFEGIETTKNNYQTYALSPNGDVNLQLKSKKTGKYKLSFQVQDELGNESEVKQVALEVSNPLNIELTRAFLIFNRKKISGGYQNAMSAFAREFTATAGNDTKIVKIAYKVKFTTDYGENVERNYEENVSATDKVAFDNQNSLFTVSDTFVMSTTTSASVKNGTLTVTLYNDKGTTLEKSIPAEITQN